MAGIIGFDFKDRGLFPGGGSVNSITVPGVYVHNKDGDSNDEFWFIYGALIVFRASSSYGNIVVQVAIGKDNAEYKCRLNWGGSWGTWRTLG